MRAKEGKRTSEGELTARMEMSLSGGGATAHLLWIRMKNRYQFPIWLKLWMRPVSFIGGSPFSPRITIPRCSPYGMRTRGCSTGLIIRPTFT